MQNLGGDWADNIKVGDLILCDTKNGHRQVKVTRIETLDECPVKFQVKKVVRHNYISNGVLVNVGEKRDEKSSEN